MPERERTRFNILRRWHRKSFGPVVTELMTPVLDAIVERGLGNLGSVPGACPGIVIDGKPGVGKSTTATLGGLLYERKLRDIFQGEMEEWPEDEWVPVVYHSLDTPATVKNLNRGLVEFYAGAYPRQAGTAELTDRVIRHVQKCATTLIIIDVHYLGKGRESDDEVNDHLKMLMNETSATFVYAGVGCTKTKLLTEGRPEAENEDHLAQTRRRFAVHELDPFEIDSPEGLASWGMLLNSFEENLVLLNAEPGTLASNKMARYLHDRTGGFIGSLATLLREAANKAVELGEEEVTPEILGKVNTDYAAEKEFPVRQKRRRKS